MTQRLFACLLSIATVGAAPVGTVTPARALVSGDRVYIGVYNFAGQDTEMWIAYRVRLPDGRVTWDKARHILLHRIKKLVGVRITTGKLADCQGGIITRRTDSNGKVWETRDEADLCKLYRVRLDSGRAGPTKVKLDYSRKRDPSIWKDPWH